MIKKTSFKILISLCLLLGLISGVVLVQKAILYFSGASGLPANLIIDMTTDYGTSTDTWRALAQGGEEKGRWLSSIIPQVKALKPEYIRIDHVFDFYPSDNLTELDGVINDITATGAIPFISLSYMPPAISKSGQVDDLPKNWTDWELSVKKLIEHISGTNSLNLNNVYYEVWNEPDLFGKFKISGSKSYLDLYYHSAIGASRAKGVNSFKFGGPATTGYYPNWMNGLLNFASKNSLRLDFLSWHKYSKNMSEFEADTASARSLLAKYNMNGREMIITEMGPNGANDKIYDTELGAIHELATIIILQNELAKTFTFEIKDGVGPSKYWGRWGLYTNDKFGAPTAKPRAQAIQFLNNLIGGTKLAVLGQGSFVRAMAKKLSPSLSRILVVNYDVNGNHNETVPVTLLNLPSGNFTFKTIDFSGNILSQEVSTTEAVWKTGVYFKPNSASIFEINFH